MRPGQGAEAQGPSGSWRLRPVNRAGGPGTTLKAHAPRCSFRETASAQMQTSSPSLTLGGGLCFVDGIYCCQFCKTKAQGLFLFKCVNALYLAVLLRTWPTAVSFREPVS